MFTIEEIKNGNSQDIFGEFNQYFNLTFLHERNLLSQCRVIVQTPQFPIRSISIKMPLSRSHTFLSEPTTSLSR